MQQRKILKIEKNYVDLRLSNGYSLMTKAIDISEWQYWEIINDYSDFLSLSEIIDLCSIKVASKRVNIRCKEAALQINELFIDEKGSEPSEIPESKIVSRDFDEKESVETGSKHGNENKPALLIQKYIRASLNRYKSLFVEKKAMMLRRFICTIDDNYIQCYFYYFKEKLQFVLTFKNISFHRNSLKKIIIYLHAFKDELGSIQKVKYLADFIWENLVISVVFDHIHVDVKDSRIRVENVHKDNTPSSLKKEVLLKFVNAIVMIQRLYRRGKRRELQSLMVESKNIKVNRQKLLAKRVKKIDSSYYRIIAFENSEGGFNFVLINLDDGKTYRYSFYSETQKVINTKGLQLIDYLLELVTIKNGAVDFQIETDNPYAEVGPRNIKKLRNEEEEKAQAENLNQDMYRVLQLSIPENDTNRVIYSVVIGEGNVNQNPNKVEVKMSLLDLQRRIPNLSLKDPKSVRSFAKEITSSFKIAHSGEIHVDVNKIDPLCVKMDDHPIFRNSEANLKKIKNETKKVLCKTTRISEDKKFLIISYLLERCLATRDDVFEEYEIVFQFVASLLSTNGKSKELVWEIPKYDVFDLTGNENDFKAAKSIMDRLFVFEEKSKAGGLKYIFASRSKSEVQRLTSPIVMAIDCKILPLIQKRFRNRVFIRNYKLYRNDIDLTGKKIIKKDTIVVFGIQYLFVLYERSATNIGVFAWDLDLFKKLMRDFDILPYEASYLRDKERFAVKMLKHLSVKQDGRGIIFEEIKFSNELVKNDIESPMKKK